MGTLKRDTILLLLAEGGSLRVTGLKLDGLWNFQFSVSDCLDDDDLSPSVQKPPENFFSFSEVLTALDRHRHWFMLFPQEVHSQFRRRLWSAVAERVAQLSLEEFESWPSPREDWVRLCGVTRPAR